MPLLDVQRRNREIGRIRAGYSEATGRTGRGGREIRRPVKSGTFLLTSADRRVIAAAAQLYGGTVEAWTEMPGQWRVITETNRMTCAVPGSDAALNQCWELWNGGVCVRRCDGVTESLRQKPCLCPEDLAVRRDAAKQGQACTVKSRINLILPDLPGLGVWRMDTSSWNAALEIGAVAELLARARDQGVIVPAELRQDARESSRLVDIGIRPDKSRGIKGERVETRKFYVPVLDPLPTLREMAELSSRPLAAMLPPPPQQMKAITAGQAPTPVYGVPVAPDAPVQPPAAWAREEQDQVDAAAATEPSAGERGPQDVADDARAASDLAAWSGLWNEATDRGWLDEYVASSPDQPGAPHDTLRVVLMEVRAAIKEGL